MAHSFAESTTPHAVNIYEKACQHCLDIDLFQESPTFFKSILEESLVEAGAVDEFMVYWLESFGNFQRIDYGTGRLLFKILYQILVRLKSLNWSLGHELCFVSLLTALTKQGVRTRTFLIYLLTACLLHQISGLIF